MVVLIFLSICDINTIINICGTLLIIVMVKSSMQATQKIKKSPERGSKMC